MLKETEKLFILSIIREKKKREKIERNKQLGNRITEHSVMDFLWRTQLGLPAWKWLSDSCSCSVSSFYPYRCCDGYSKQIQSNYQTLCHSQVWSWWTLFPPRAAKKHIPLTLAATEEISISWQVFPVTCKRCFGERTTQAGWNAMYKCGIMVPQSLTDSVPNVNRPVFQPQQAQKCSNPSRTNLPGPPRIKGSGTADWSVARITNVEAIALAKELCPSLETWKVMATWTLQHQHSWGCLCAHSLLWQHDSSVTSVTVHCSDVKGPWTFP